MKTVFQMQHHLVAGYKILPRQKTGGHPIAWVIPEITFEKVSSQNGQWLIFFSFCNKIFTNPSYPTPLRWLRIRTWFSTWSLWDHTRMLNNMIFHFPNRLKFRYTLSCNRRLLTDEIKSEKTIVALLNTSEIQTNLLPKLSLTQKNLPIVKIEKMANKCIPDPTTKMCDYHLPLCGA